MLLWPGIPLRRLWERWGDDCWLAWYRLRSVCYGVCLRCPGCGRRYYYLRSTLRQELASYPMEICGRCHTMWELLPNWTLRRVPMAELSAAEQVHLRILSSDGECVECILEREAAILPADDQDHMRFLYDYQHTLCAIHRAESANADD